MITSQIQQEELVELEKMALPSPLLLQQMKRIII